MDDTCSFCSSHVVEHDERYDRCTGCSIYRKRGMPSKEQVKEACRHFMLSACWDIERRRERLDNAKRQLAVLNRFAQCESGAVRSVFDVGAAAGFFMKAALDDGWSVFGNDLSVDAIEWAMTNYGLDIIYGIFEDMSFEPESFDAVVLWNTLEHLIDPAKALTVAAGALKRDGVIFMRIPDKTEDEIRKHYDPGHLYEFNSEGLQSFMSSLEFEAAYESLKHYPRWGRHADIIFKKKVD